MTKEEYKDYLKSAHWQKVRKRYSESKYPQYCIVCGSERFQLHHKTYLRIGCERLNDLIPLCQKDHHEFHRWYATCSQKSLRGATRAWLRLQTEEKRLPAVAPEHTEMVILAGRTAAGGWTRQTLQSWGVAWPPPKGWKRALIKSGINT